MGEVGCEKFVSEEAASAASERGLRGASRDDGEVEDELVV